MHIGTQEWQELQARCGSSVFMPGPLKALYHRLADAQPDAATRAEAAEFLRSELQALQPGADDPPASPQDLLAWMDANAQSVHERYASYLAERKAGAPRRYFSNRAHALYVLRGIAPTKLVDGAWLYGLMPHWRSPRLSDLVRTYVEELGEGRLDKNHVALYRGLLSRHALDPLDDLPDGLYRQGLIQLALAWNAEAFLPEIVGFNLGYEQLPLHLLVTSYELNELGIDPYYFTLHVTVDNSGTGHARRACEAALAMLPRGGDAASAWERMRNGARLGCAGTGTTDVVASFDLEGELVRVLAHKARAGSGAHSDYCRLAGRSVNDWLRDPAQIPDFLRALEAAGWIRRGEEPAESRFWRLVQGERAEMFGVFSAYELQVLHDWIRGPASADGRPYDEAAPQGEAPRRRATFRARVRHLPDSGADAGALLDPDLVALRERLREAQEPERSRILVQAMSPAQHWTPAGLEATRIFWAAATG